MPILPPGRQTRSSSRAVFSWSGANIAPKVDSTTSNEASSNGSVLRIALDELDVVALGGRALTRPLEQCGDVVEADGVAESGAQRRSRRCRRHRRRRGRAVPAARRPPRRGPRRPICAAVPIFAKSPCDQICCWIWVTTWRSGGRRSSGCTISGSGGRLPIQWINGRLGERLSRAALVVAVARRSRWAAALVASPAAAGMRSHKVGRHLCKTVQRRASSCAIPGFPGEKIDRRLLPDIRWMKRRFDIFITDGYSRDPVHAENGEHPIGLATDIVPNRVQGRNLERDRRARASGRAAAGRADHALALGGLERRCRARAGQPPAPLVVSLPKPARASRARRLHPHMPEVRGTTA